MFTLEGKLTFINIDQSYLKKLHDACSEVYYKPNGYDMCQALEDMKREAAKEATEKATKHRRIRQSCYCYRIKHSADRDYILSSPGAFFEIFLTTIIKSDIITLALTNINI